MEEKHRRRHPLVQVWVSVCLTFGLCLGVSKAHAQPFTALQPGFTQSVFGHASSFFGGVAFAPDGDVYVDTCDALGSPLFRFDLQSTIVEFTTTNHPQAVGSPFVSNAGCGLTNHPDGFLYSNISDSTSFTGGVAKLDANTGAPITVFGPAGNTLGITVDPQTNNLVYVARDCRGSATCTIVSIDPVSTISTNFAVLTLTDTLFVDGIAFDPTGDFLFLANRTPSTRLTILNRSGTIVQHIPMTSEADGIAFHVASPNFVVTNNTDGTLTRFDFPGNDFTLVPTQAVFASGGFRGDLSQVGGDSCLYVTQAGTRFNNGTISGDNSVVRICGGFAPPPGVPTPTGPTPTDTPTLTASPTPSVTPSPVLLDHFTCYTTHSAHGAAPFNGVLNPPGVSLVDQFGPATSGITGASFVCAPTNKVGEDPTAPLHSEHLTGYRFTNAFRPSAPPIKVKVVDQFNLSGIFFSVKAKKASHLLVPTVKHLSVTPPTPAQFMIDHFDCYKVGITKGTPKFVPVTGVTVQDQFGPMTVDVRKPKYLCAPVDKNGEDPTAPNHSLHLLCYGVKQINAVKFKKISGVRVNNQFGPQILDVKKPSEICVPSLKTLIP